MSPYFKKAVVSDLAGNRKSAIELYVDSIEHEELVIDAYLNLIGILTEISVDDGIAVDLVRTREFSEKQIIHLISYLPPLMRRAAGHFGSNEIEFWKYYNENFYSEFERERILTIIEKDPSSLIPYFLLYFQDLSNDADIFSYSSKITELKEALVDQKTIKNKYVLSLIESAEHQKTLRAPGFKFP